MYRIQFHVTFEEFSTQVLEFALFKYQLIHLFSINVIKLIHI